MRPYQPRYLRAAWRAMGRSAGKMEFLPNRAMILLRNEHRTDDSNRARFRVPIEYEY